MPERGFDNDTERLQGESALEQSCRLYETALYENEQALTYIRDTRGFSEETLRHFHIGYAPDSSGFIINQLHTVEGIPLRTLEKVGLIGRKDSGDGSQGRTYGYFRNRIMFPLMQRGKVIGFMGRVLGNEETAKYLNSPEMPLYHKGAFLYHFDEVETRRAAVEAGQIYVVEGTTDVMRAWQNGMYNVVAPCGTALTQEQFSLIEKLGVGTIICFDGDNAGIKAAERSVETLLGYPISVHLLPRGHDFDSLVKEQGDFNPSLHGVMYKGFEFLFGQKTKDLNIADADDMLVLVERLKPAMRNVPLDRRGVYYDFLRTNTILTRDTLEKLFANVPSPEQNAAKSNSDSNNAIWFERRLIRQLVLLCANDFRALEHFQRYGLEELVQSPEAKAVLKYLTENAQHGRHNVLGTDLFDVQAWSQTYSALKKYAPQNTELNEAELRLLFNTNSLSYKGDSGNGAIRHDAVKGSIFELMVADIENILRASYYGRGVSLEALRRFRERMKKRKNERKK